MIGYFPPVYKDELLYSMLSRGFRWSMVNGYRSLTMEYFGKRTVSPTIEFQSNLNVLTQRIELDVTGEQILNHHTLYPLYEPFLSKEEQKSIKSMMLGDGGLGIKGKIGFLAGSVCKKNSLVFCPMCVKEDAVDGNELYFKVVHQMQGVKACVKHGCALEDYPVKHEAISRIEYVWLDEQLVCDVEVREPQVFDVVISDYFDKIYEGYIQGYDGVKLIELYKERLKEKQCVKIKGSIDYDKFITEFELFYGESTLKRYESTIEPEEFAWHRSMLRSRFRKLHPVRHVLMIHFLFGSVDNLIVFGKKENKARYYPCLNKVTNHYKERVIENVEITYDYKSRVPVGNFKCSICGFHYSRKMNSDEYRIGRIKDFGWQWKEQFKLIANRDDLSLREKARRMYCDPNTVKKYTNPLVLDLTQDI